MERMKLKYSAGVEDDPENTKDKTNRSRTSTRLSTCLLCWVVLAPGTGQIIIRVE